ncbi:MAG: hypothetical protein JWO28_65 [Hyphomicrobiales bacterium]|nr:hypothetical protein [Hyphomicrobiales bacterium]
MAVTPGGTEYDDDELDALFKAVGFVVVQWGQAEQSLDLATAILYQNLGGKQCAKRLPKMLETKLAFLIECLSQLPTLALLRAEGEALASNFRKLSNERHDLIHGAVATVSAKDGAFTFAKLDIKEDFHVVREVRLEASQFRALTRALLDLGAQATAFARRLWELVPK